MTELLLLTNILQTAMFLVFCVWYTKSKDEQVRDMVRSILSRNAYEFSESKIIEKAPKKEATDTFDDLVSTDDMSDNDFDQVIKDINENNL